MNRIPAILGLIGCLQIGGAAEGPLAQWNLTEDARDSTGAGHHARNHGVIFQGSEGAHFNGSGAWLEVPATKSLNLADRPFTLSVWIHTEQSLDDSLGDILNWFNPKTRNGFNLGLLNYSGITCAQSNWRNIFFGIDAGSGGDQWIDRGRPGNNQLINSLVVFDDDLYATTWEPGATDRGHIYRYAGETNWVDCGSPSPANTIKSAAVYRGKLYVGSERYSGGGSSLPLSPNETDGGHVYRYDGGTNWTDCGKIADVRSVSGLAVYRDRLYAGTGTTGAWRDKPRRRGMYRFDGIGKWTDCGCPGNRTTHLGVHDGNLYGLSYDAGEFYRYDGGTNWYSLGPVTDTTQVYSMISYQGKLHVGTWPTGSVFEYDGPQSWIHRGRLGQEKEVMALSVYNGKFYAGTLPQADVYRYDGDSKWTNTGQLDHTPDVKYRRAWSMAVFDGKLFCGTLPSGHVLSLEAGKATSYDRQLTPGWHHLSAVRGKNSLQLHLDGRLVSKSTSFNPRSFDLDPGTSLKIGFGQHDYFNGRMKDLRIYDRALNEKQIRELATRR
jgi:hypothetical protein